MQCAGGHDWTTTAKEEDDHDDYCAMLSNSDDCSSGGVDCHDVETDDVITVISCHIISCCLGLTYKASPPFIVVLAPLFILCCYRS